MQPPRTRANCLHTIKEPRHEASVGRQLLANEIIKFGAVKCGRTSGRTFSCFVKPQVAKHISSTISPLPSVTDGNFDREATFMQSGLGTVCVVMTWEHFRYFNPH